MFFGKFGCFVFLKHPFRDTPLCLITDDNANKGTIWIDNKSSYPLILKGYAHFFTQIIMTNSSTAWKVSVFEVFLVLIFPHSDWIRRDTECLSVFGQNAVKHGPEKLRIWILFTQCRSCHFSNSSFFSK